MNTSKTMEIVPVLDGTVVVKFCKVRSPFVFDEGVVVDEQLFECDGQDILDILQIDFEQVIIRDFFKSQENIEVNSRYFFTKDYYGQAKVLCLRRKGDALVDSFSLHCNSWENLFRDKPAIVHSISFYISRGTPPAKKNKMDTPPV